MQKITSKTKIYILIVFIVVIALFYFYKTSTSQQVNAYKCPENYEETDASTAEYKNALTNWTSEFFKENPKATMSNWAIAKLKLWEDNNCKVAIERSKLSGQVSDLKQWEKVDYEVQNIIEKTINLSK